jgi:carbonic anhydrase
MVISLSAFSTRPCHGARGSHRPVDNFGGHIEKHCATQADEAGKKFTANRQTLEFKRETRKRRFHSLAHDQREGPMSKIVDEVVAANKKYASGFGAKKDLALPPARGFAILTCMDARLDPAKYAGLAEGDAHVIRNAGGRATDDAIRSLVISHKLLGTREWFVIHHTNCGMELFTDGVMGDLLDDNLETANFDGKLWSNPTHGNGASSGRFIKWHTITDQPSSVTDDVRRIREHPLVSGKIPIYGYVYDVHSGSVVEVREATAAGRPR